MFENPRNGRQARNFTTNVPKILDLKSSSDQIFSENCRWVPLIYMLEIRGTSTRSSSIFFHPLDPWRQSLSKTGAFVHLSKLWQVNGAIRQLKKETRPEIVYSRFSTHFDIWQLDAELGTLSDSLPPPSGTRSSNSVPYTYIIMMTM